MDGASSAVCSVEAPIIASGWHARKKGRITFLNDLDGDDLCDDGDAYDEVEEKSDILLPIFILWCISCRGLGKRLSGHNNLLPEPLMVPVLHDAIQRLNLRVVEEEQFAFLRKVLQ